MVRNQVRIQAKYETMTCTTSQVDRTETHSNYIRNKPKRPVLVKNI